MFWASMVFESGESNLTNFSVSHLYFFYLVLTSYFEIFFDQSSF